MEGTFIINGGLSVWLLCDIHGTFNAATRTNVRHPPENRHAAVHGQQFLFAIASRASKNIVSPIHYTPNTIYTLFSPLASENRAKSLFFAPATRISRPKITLVGCFGRRVRNATYDHTRHLRKDRMDKGKGIGGVSTLDGYLRPRSTLAVLPRKHHSEAFFSPLATS